MMKSAPRPTNKDKKFLVLHPFLFVAYPLLLLFAKNPDEVLLSDVVGVFVILASLLLPVLLGLQLVLRDRAKAAVLLTALIILFFTYSSVRGLLMHVQIGPFEIGRHRYLLPAWAIAAVGVFAASWLSRRDLRPVSSYLNIVGVILVLMCVSNLSLSKLTNVSSQQKALTISVEKELTDVLRWTGNGKMPDIYYIILDQYSRADVLKRDFGYDNSEFLNYLRDKGFYVADGSRANYPRTHWSLPSSLNYNSLDTLAAACGVEVMSYPLLQRTIRESRMRQALEGLGYRFVQPASAFALTENGSNPRGGLLLRALQFNEFKRVLLDTTALGPLRLSDPAVRKRHLSTFEYLARVSDVADPTFAFFHICCPHPPYVFGRDGNLPNTALSLSTDELRASYVEQVEYVNVLTRRAIDKILAASDPEPIIIIQSDHGYLPEDFFDDPNWDATNEKARMAMDMRTAILNAYYFPGVGKERLYDTITPVNSFRVLLNTYFGGNLPLLEDTVYFPKSPFAEWNTLFCRNNMIKCPPDM